MDEEPPSATKRGSDRGSTRERILDVALNLLNERGPERMTTAQVAAAAQINEGNLYYYFRTKQALVLAIFERFDRDVDELLMVWTDTNVPAAYLELLRKWFATVWRYRFLFRDLLGLLATSPELEKRINATSVRLREPVESIVETMHVAGLLEIPEVERQPLLGNVWIVATYWVIYLHVQNGVREFDETHLQWGLRQVLSLFRPYLIEEVRAWLDGVT